MENFVHCCCIPNIEHVYLCFLENEMRLKNSLRKMGFVFVFVKKLEFYILVLLIEMWNLLFLKDFHLFHI